MQGPRIWEFYPEGPSKENKKKGAPGTDTHGHAAYACAARVMLKLYAFIPTETDQRGQHLCSVARRTRVSPAGVVRRQPRKFGQCGLDKPVRCHPMLVYAIHSLLCTELHSLCCAHPGSWSYREF